MVFRDFFSALRHPQGAGLRHTRSTKLQSPPVSIIVVLLFFRKTPLFVFFLDTLQLMRCESCDTKRIFIVVTFTFQVFVARARRRRGFKASDKLPKSGYLTLDGVVLLEYTFKSGPCQHGRQEMIVRRKVGIAAR